MNIRQTLAAWRPTINVTVRRAEIHLVGTEVFVAAPVIWYNDKGQVAAVGEHPEASARGYRRVELIRAGDVLVESGEGGRAAELFLRYAFAVATSSHRLRSWLRPRVVYAEEAGSLAEGRSCRTQRFAAFSALARAAGASSVHAAETYAG